jgi:hypothetical protein
MVMGLGFQILHEGAGIPCGEGHIQFVDDVRLIKRNHQENGFWLKAAFPLWGCRNRPLRGS